MSKLDVQKSMSNYVKQNYDKLNVLGRNKPKTIKKVLATIQDREYNGAGKYNVVFDIYGSEVNDIGDLNENVHYTATCSVSVASDSEGSPIPSLNDSLILTKQSF